MLQIILTLVLFVLLIIPIGRYMFHIATGQHTFCDPVFNRIDNGIYRICGINQNEGMGWKKWLLVFGLTDETFSIHCAAKEPAGVDRGWFMLCVSLLDHSYWMLGSLIGCLAGGLFAFDTTGIDFVMTALFVVIFLDQWKQQKNHGPALVGLGASALCLLAFGPDGFLLPAMALIVAGITLCRGRWEESA